MTVSNESARNCDVRTVCCRGESRVHRTALAELALTLGCPWVPRPQDDDENGHDGSPPQTPSGALRVVRNPGKLPARGGIHLALLAESPEAQALCRAGLCNLHNLAPAADAFAGVQHAGTTYLLGNSPRGLLQAVYGYQDRLARGGPVRTASFQPQYRIFHQRFDGWPGSRADVRYLSRLGASHCLVSHDWHGNRRLMQGYVTSPVFPEAIPPTEVAANAAALRRLLDDCADYALDAALWLTEFPCQGGPWVPEGQRQEFLTRFPADCLSDSGTYEGRVLCFSHPQVQAFYRDLVQRFFAAFPEIGLLFLFGLDSSGEFCDPAACPRCRGLSRFDQRDRLLRFLLEEGQRVRPGLQVLTTNWGWDKDPTVFVQRQAALPAGVGVYLAAQRDGWQCERQVHDLMRDTRRVCRERGQLFIGYDNLHWGDDSVHGLGDIQDYPLGIAAKLRRWHGLGVDGVFDHWGTWPEDVSCNSLACREFFLNPMADPEPVCRDIAVAQFGPKAAPHVLTTWRALEHAHGILSNACTWSPWQWPGWYRGRAVRFEPEPMNQHLAALAAHAESAKPAGTITYNAGTLAERLQAVSDAWEHAWPHYRRAIAAMRRAVALADDSRPVGQAHWWYTNPEAADGSLEGERTHEPAASRPPTPRQHLERQLRYIESTGLAGYEIGLHFGVLACHESCGRDMTVFRRSATPLIRKNYRACLAAAAFFEHLPGGPPPAVAHWPEQYRKKAERP